jgi:hypothetical protein
MSIDYNFTNCEVSVKFNSDIEMRKQIKEFEQECHEYTDDGIYVPAYIVQTDDEKKELKARVIVSESEYVEIDELAELICKHFPKSNGIIGWASAEESAGGYVRYAGGGRLEIKDGKVVPDEYEQIKELKEDLYELLNYVGEVVSNGDITECGVSHLFKKYMNEEYNECLRNKED